jgi:N-acyl-D-amino-acid deacylase
MTARVSLSLVLALLLGLAAGAGARGWQPPTAYDLLIRNGRVLDGTGNPWFPADVAVKDGRIVAVGELGAAPATTVIDATGKYVTPGFIDIHSHADDGSSPRGGLRDPDPARRAAPNLVSQGITTVVVNHDGRSPWPIADQRALLETQGIGVNAMLLVGHGTIRRRVMGADEKQPAAPPQVARMRELLRQGLAEGAVGLSAGLEYEPGRWSTTAELVELARELPAVDGIYIAHERSEGTDPLWYVPSQDGPGPPTLLDAVAETIEIGEATGARGGPPPSSGAPPPAPASSPRTSRPRASTSGDRAPRRSTSSSGHATVASTSGRTSTPTPPAAPTGPRC